MLSSGFHMCMKSTDTADTGAHQGDLYCTGDTEKVALGLPISVFSMSYIYIIDMQSIAEYIR